MNHRFPRRATPVAAAALTLGVVLTATAACSSGGPERSVEAFCTTMSTHRQAYLDQMASARGVGGILDAVVAVGDLKVMWDELADVAPADIRKDVESVRDTWDEQQDAAASGEWMSSVVTGLLGAGSMGRVDAYVRQNCDGDYEVPADDPTDDEETVDATPPPPAVQTALVTVDGLATGGDAVLDAEAGVLYTAATELPTRSVPFSVHLEPGQHAGAMEYGVEAFAGEPVTVAAAGWVVTEENGLNPETSTLVLQTFDGDGTVVVDKPVDQSILDRLRQGSVDNDYDGRFDPEVDAVRVVHGTVVVAFDDDFPGVVAGFDGKTGALLWTLDAVASGKGCGSETAFHSAGPVTSGGLYVYSNHDTVFAVDARTGAPAWTAPITGSCNTWLDADLNPVVDDFVVAPGNGVRATVVDARTGAVVTQDVSSYAFDPVTGELALSYVDERTPAEGRPALEVRDATGTVFALPAEQGQALGRLDVEAAFDGRVWITTTAGSSVVTAADGAADQATTDGYGSAVVRAGTAGWTLVGGGDRATLLLHPGQTRDLTLLGYAARS